MNAATLGATPERLGGLLQLVVALLLCIGLVMVASASMDVTAAQWGHPFYFLLRHLVYVVFGVTLGFFVYQMPLAWWQGQRRTALALGLALLVLVLLPVIGRHVNGSSRWIGVGPLTLQPSEIAKLTMVLYMAGFLDRFEQDVRHRWPIGRSVAPCLIYAIALMLEPDFGATIVLCVSVAAMLWLAGSPLLRYLALLVLAAALAAIAVVHASYRLQRLIAYTDPWAHPLGSGYQLIQSEIAYGRGGLFGVGLGNSVQKLFYLPEAHTDFVLAVLAEEFGLLGLSVILALFVILVLQGLRIGRQAEMQGRLFAAYLAYGLSVLIGIQALINMAVTAGALPTKGLTLPLVSYGGSSLIIELVMVALLLRVDRENAQALEVAA